jgi:hypothetical protein
MNEPMFIRSVDDVWKYLELNGRERTVDPYNRIVFQYVVVAEELTAPTFDSAQFEYCDIID